MCLLAALGLAWAETGVEEASGAESAAVEGEDAEAPADETETSADGEEAPADGEGEEADAPQPANGYVLVTTSTQAGWLPLPDEGEYSYSLKQTMSDGTEVENVIHLTPNGVYMEDSTCENHDCVMQGEVTLENKEDRILSNMIICLPNQVYLQLFTPEEVLEMFTAQQEEGVE